MASPRSIEVKVGILILSAIGLLVTFILIMGGINFQPTYSIYIDFDNPGGLQRGAPVKIAGVKVGTVADIPFCGPDTAPEAGRCTGMVRLKASIESRHRAKIRNNAVFYVTTQGVLGEQFLAIEPGSLDQPELLANTAVRGKDPPRLDLLLAESYELLHKSVEGLNQHGPELREAFEGLKRTLKGTGDFFEHNSAKLDAIATNAEKVSAHADDLVVGAKSKFIDNPQIDRVLSNVDSVAAVAARDAPPLLADAKETLAGAKRVATTIGAPEEQAKIKQAIHDVAEIAARGKAATSDAAAVVAHIRRGKGTVGALVMDEQLYDDLQELARDLKHNPWKFLWRE